MRWTTISFEKLFIRQHFTVKLENIIITAQNFNVDINIIYQHPYRPTPTLFRNSQIQWGVVVLSCNVPTIHSTYIPDLRFHKLGWEMDLRFLHRIDRKEHHPSTSALVVVALLSEEYIQEGMQCLMYHERKYEASATRSWVSPKYKLSCSSRRSDQHSCCSYEILNVTWQQHSSMVIL